jgi:hypothetical protein
MLAPQHYFSAYLREKIDSTIIQHEGSSKGICRSLEQRVSLRVKAQKEKG